MSIRRQDVEAQNEQVTVLLELSRRLSSGDRPLPTDVFRQLVDELERRVDEEAIVEAWAIQGDEEATPWATVRARALG